MKRTLPDNSAPKHNLIARLGQPRLLLGFALSLAGGLGMLGIGWTFLSRYLEYPSYIGDRYYGPPLHFILLWIACGLAAIAGSALVVRPGRALAWGLVVLVVSSVYALFSAAWFSIFEFPYAFSAALLPATASLLGLLGGVFAISSTYARSHRP